MRTIPRTLVFHYKVVHIITNFLAWTSSVLMITIRTNPKQKPKAPSNVSIEGFDSEKLTTPPATIMLKRPSMPANTPDGH